MSFFLFETEGESGFLLERWRHCTAVHITLAVEHVVAMSCIIEIDCRTNRLPQTCELASAVSISRFSFLTFYFYLPPTSLNSQNSNLNPRYVRLRHSHPYII